MIARSSALGSCRQSLVAGALILSAFAWPAEVPSAVGSGIATARTVRGGVGGARGAPAATEIIERVLAVVDREVITLSDARAALALGLIESSSASDPISAALDPLIDRVVILMEVERYAPPEPDAALIEKRVEEYRGRFASDPEFQKMLTETGVSAGRLRDIARNDLRIEGYLDQRFSNPAEPSEEELRQFMEQIGGSGSSGGVPITREEARRRLVTERRSALMSEWLAALRRRSEISVLYLPK